MHRFIASQLFSFCILFSCNPANQHAGPHGKNTEELKQDENSKKNKFTSKILSFDWNNDGIADSIYLNGVKEEYNVLTWEQVVIKVCGQKVLDFGEEPVGDPFFTDVKDWLESAEIRSKNKIQSELIVKLATDNNPLHDVLLFRGWPFDDGSRLYIVKLNDKGDPCVVFDQLQDRPYFKWTSAGLNLIMQQDITLGLNDFYWDTDVNGPVPDLAGKMKNKQGNVLEVYDPFIVYKFTKDSMVADTMLSETYNKENNLPWHGINTIGEWVVFYKSEKDSAVFYKRDEFIKTWESLSK